MLCDICHKNIATIHLTEIVGDKIVELHLCSKCAQMKTEEIKNQLSLSEFLTGLVKEEKKERRVLRCAKCGLTFNDFRKMGKLGCKFCYESFREKLLPLLRKIHGSVEHTGKVPQGLKEEEILERKIRELRKKLAKAIKLEEYEEAARIRDEIRNLEKKRDV
ncbi:MAG: hypothetical protein DRP76_00285 [Candidatus Omnitrophota bacterium]|nr:MAG: hypothetical protein DRP76_00285 [Candidatus Omnitrophota bacterium]